MTSKSRNFISHKWWLGQKDNVNWGKSGVEKRNISSPDPVHRYQTCNITLHRASSIPEATSTLNHVPSFLQPTPSPTAHPHPSLLSNTCLPKKAISHLLLPHPQNIHLAAPPPRPHHQFPLSCRLQIDVKWPEIKSDFRQNSSRFSSEDFLNNRPQLILALRCYNWMKKMRWGMKERGRWEEGENLWAKKVTGGSQRGWRADCHGKAARRGAARGWQIVVGARRG